MTFTRADRRHEARAKGTAGSKPGHGQQPQWIVRGKAEGEHLDQSHGAATEVDKDGRLWTPGHASQMTHRVGIHFGAEGSGPRLAAGPAVRTSS